MPEIKYICDRCFSTKWEEPVDLIIEVWGKDIMICHKCGVVRYPKELEKVLL